MEKGDEGMSHPDEGRLQAFLDGELTVTEEAGLRSHLEGIVSAS